MLLARVDDLTGRMADVACEACFEEVGR